MSYAYDWGFKDGRGLYIYANYYPVNTIESHDYREGFHTGMHQFHQEYNQYRALLVTITACVDRGQVILPDDVLARLRVFNLTI